MGLLDKVLSDTQRPELNYNESPLVSILINYTENIEKRNYEEVNQIIAKSKIQLQSLPGLDELLTRITNVIQCRESYYKTRLEMVTKAIEVGLWEMDVCPGDPINPDNEFRWSPEFRAMLGYNDEKDFPNRFDSWSRLLHPDEEEEVLGKFIDHLLDYTGKTKFDAEYRLLTTEGKYKWFRATGTSIRDKSGNPIMIAGALFDIDARKKKEDELHQMVLRSRLINQVINEATWQVKLSWPNPLDPNHEVKWSKQFRKMLGYNSVDEFPSVVNSLLNITHPDDMDRFVRAINDHLTDFTGKTEYDITYRLRTKMGDYRWFHVRGQSNRNEEGIPLIITGTIQDVTRDVNKDHVIKLVKFHLDELLGDINII